MQARECIPNGPIPQEKAVANREHQINRRLALQAGITAVLAGRVLTQAAEGVGNDAEKNMVEEEGDLPLFTTMEEWEKSPLLGDENNGFFGRMRALSNEFAEADTSIMRNRLRGKLQEIGNDILYEIGNPPPPILQKKLRHSYSKNFSHPLRDYLWKYSTTFPLKIQAGKVNGAMVANYIRQVTALPLEIADEATKNILEQTTVHITRRQTLQETVALLCNTSKVDMDIGPIGGRSIFDGGVPLNLALVHFGPWHAAQYLGSRFSLRSVGQFAVHDNEPWHFYSSLQDPNDSGKEKRKGFWAPSGIAVRKIGIQEGAIQPFSPDLLPLRDPRSGGVITYDATQGFYALDKQEAEKLFAEELPELVWGEATETEFDLEVWHHKKAKFS